VRLDTLSRGRDDAVAVIKRCLVVGSVASALALAALASATRRNAFGAGCGVPGASSFTKLKGRATIRGIGFFDLKHGQTGVAPNGIELHPALRFIDATCEVVP